MKHDLLEGHVHDLTRLRVQDLARAETLVIAVSDKDSGLRCSSVLALFAPIFLQMLHRVAPP
eukprot:2465623-Rhodomonas_salina.1